MINCRDMKKGEVYACTSCGIKLQVVEECRDDHSDHSCDCGCHDTDDSCTCFCCGCEMKKE